MAEGTETCEGKNRVSEIAHAADVTIRARLDTNPGSPTFPKVGEAVQVDVPLDLSMTTKVAGMFWMVGRVQGFKRAEDWRR